jgi:hypothetical protein
LPCLITNYTLGWGMDQLAHPRICISAAHFPEDGVIHRLVQREVFDGPVGQGRLQFRTRVPENRAVDHGDLIDDGAEEFAEINGVAMRDAESLYRSMNIHSEPSALKKRSY